MALEFLQQGLQIGNVQHKPNHSVLMQETNCCLKRKNIKKRDEKMQREEMEEVARLQKESVHKANPIQSYKPTNIMISSKLLTEPQGPSFFMSHPRANSIWIYFVFVQLCLKTKLIFVFWNVDDSSLSSSFVVCHLNVVISERVFLCYIFKNLVCWISIICCICIFIYILPVKK